MFQNYGAGIQACYRGPRLYDTPETKEAVKAYLYIIRVYYTGLKGSAQIREQEGTAQTHPMDCNENVELTVTIPANGYTWYVVK